MNREGSVQPTAALSDRENEILSLLIEGHSDAEIARSLILQLSTVKWYNRQIFNKLKVHNRREAVQRARLERARRSAYRLPAPPTALVGRVQETAAVCRLMHEARLVTVIAPGGMGKTRLALAAAERLSKSFSDGACFVPLAAASSDSLVTAVAAALGLPPQRDLSPTRQLLDFLRDKSLLLVLDNFEHLLDQALLVSQMLEASPRLKVLVTSRERLFLHGEALFSLGGLSYPNGQHEDGQPSEALDLLTQCARLIIPDFELDGRSHMEAARLCQLTGGMPLAIELAAARLETLSLAEIADSISQSAAVLNTAMRDIPQRQASIQAVLAASWDQISEAERDIFVRLAVFRGGCSRRAARIVTGARSEILSSLVGKALVRLNATGRYTFHELLRQYAEEQLAARASEQAARDAHSAYYLGFLAEREGDLKGGKQSAALDEIDADFENIRAAWHWAIEHGCSERVNAALESLYWFCEMRNRIQERADLLRPAVERFSDDTRLYGRLLARSWSAGGLSALPNRTWGAARRGLRQALEIARQRDDVLEIAAAEYQRGLAAASMEHKRAAVQFYDQAQVHFMAQGDAFYTAQCLLWRAFTEVDLTAFAEAEEHSRAAIALLRQIGDDVNLARALLTLGAAVENKPDYPEAEGCYEEAYLLLHRLGAHVDAANVGGWYLAGAVLRTGDFPRYRALGEELMAVAANQNNPTLKARGLCTTSMNALIDGDANTARERAEQSIALFGDHGSGVVAQIFLGYALVILGETERARQVALPAIRQITATAFQVFDFVTLPLVAALLADAGNCEGAAAAMGLSLDHPASMVALTNLIYERLDLRARLEAALGTEGFCRAYEHGSSLTAHECFAWVIQAAATNDPILNSRG
ncbi:MAG: AAA family ATPase [Anaerolineae bacterium]|nr:AAA family ATPase [Anaerolineae bacterium]